MTLQYKTCTERSGEGLAAVESVILLFTGGMFEIMKSGWRVTGFLFSCIVLLAGCAALQQNQPETAPELRPGFWRGYLAAEMMPDSLALLPPPPAADSTASALDNEVSRASLHLRATSRWNLAAEDADLASPEAMTIFSCALDAPVSKEKTPHLYMLLRKVLADAGLSTYAAKDQYKRLRPYWVNKRPTCTPDAEERLKKDGSYPSGHAAIGWAWALTLVEVSPDQTDAILARGWAFGQSRVICNVHWQSDVMMGRIMGAAVVARLHSDPSFLESINSARDELNAVRSKGLNPARDCREEDEALSELPMGAPWPANR